jgi:hypothetical protein
MGGQAKTLRAALQCRYVTPDRSFRRRRYRTVKGNIRAIRGQIQRVESALANAELWACQLQSYGEK